MSAVRIATIVIAATLACGGESANAVGQADEQIIPFDSTVIHLVTGDDTVQVNAELALSTDQKTMGLMERHHLAPTAGMLFVYDSTQPPDAAFWMFRTRIPLDIAYMDSSGVVRAALTMAPCDAILAAGCPSYPPGVPYRYALEVNKGFLHEHRVSIGATRLALTPELLRRFTPGTRVPAP